VQATVVHENADILRLAFSDGSEVTGTGRHRFWSETRRDWVAARALREGEELRTPSGVVRVESATPSHTLTAVYNLEVEGAHEYFVGEGEVLVHNGGCADEAADATRGVGEIDDDVAEAMGSAYERRTTASGGTQVLERSMGGSGPRRWQEVPQAQTSRPHRTAIQGMPRTRNSTHVPTATDAFRSGAFLGTPRLDTVEQNSLAVGFGACVLERALKCWHSSDGSPAVDRAP